jgi:AraC-like DNA-binding protein
LHAAIRAIIAKPSRRYSTEELAMIAGMSEASIFRHFKMRYGVPPARFAMVHRMDCARKMLSALPISEVSHSLGFSDVGHFSKVFRDIVGENPGEFQKRRRSMVRSH